MVVIDAVTTNHVDLVGENIGWPLGDAGSRRAPCEARALLALVMRATPRLGLLSVLECYRAEFTAVLSMMEQSMRVVEK